MQRSRNMVTISQHVASAATGIYIGARWPHVGFELVTAATVLAGALMLGGLLSFRRERARDARRRAANIIPLDPRQREAERVDDECEPAEQSDE